ncbi:MAG: secondary thiamine-phosphate synthase enzyme YjbQ [Kiritimatiellae bacterium]|jgi:secondary thiamine-phosphate synthase enzyme|nr:secondary thiamine-phosphate synthase enzyme YjbQ [Kiritimatiellia bacterium]
MKTITISTKARTDFINITSEVQNYVRDEQIITGVITIFIPHTTAAVTINENADPDVLRDMSDTLDKMVPWQNNYAHYEGNSAAHVKSSMYGVSLQVIVENGILQLGTWQGIYFCEFDGPRNRKAFIK